MAYPRLNDLLYEPNFSGHANRLASSLLSENKPNEFCDGQVVSSDGVTFYIVSAILAQGSPAFHDMLYKHFDCDPSAVTPLPVKSDALRDVLKFCYTGASDVLEKTLSMVARQNKCATYRTEHKELVAHLHLIVRVGHAARTLKIYFLYEECKRVFEVCLVNARHIHCGMAVICSKLEDGCFGAVKTEMILDKIMDDPYYHFYIPCDTLLTNPPGMYLMEGALVPTERDDAFLGFPRDGTFFLDLSETVLRQLFSDKRVKKCTDHVVLLVALHFWATRGLREADRYEKNWACAQELAAKLNINSFPANILLGPAEQSGLFSSAQMNTARRHCLKRTYNELCHVRT